MQGVWYEIERSRGADHTSSWQSGMLLFRHDIFEQRFSYQYVGTVNRQCRGPVHAWAGVRARREGRLDVMMNLGRHQQYGNPWSVQCKTARGTVIFYQILYFMIAAITVQLYIFAVKEL